jgi:BirA family biotin operon repressor/biotin-[acetyl-CoA-carboxylase] ligase
MGKNFWAADELQNLLHTRVLGRNLVVFNRIGSTNEFLKRLARRGAAEGATVIADEQTSGRGRLGRRWHSPPGRGLWFSFLLRPQLEAEKIGLVSLAIAAVIAETLAQDDGAEYTVKWPNDVLIAGKKVCGILCETQVSPAGVESIIAGVGLNVNQYYDDLSPVWRAQATSLMLSTGKMWDRQTLFLKLLKAFDQSLCDDMASNLPRLIEKWCSRCPALGQTVTVTPAPASAVAENNETTTGIFAGIGEGGELILRMPAGNLRFFSAGEITVLK